MIASDPAEIESDDDSDAIRFNNEKYVALSRLEGDTRGLQRFANNLEDCAHQFLLVSGEARRNLKDSVRGRGGNKDTFLRDDFVADFLQRYNQKNNRKNKKNRQ